MQRWQRGLLLGSLGGGLLVGAVLALPYKEETTTINRKTATKTFTTSYFGIVVSINNGIRNEIGPFGASTAKDVEILYCRTVWRFPWTSWTNDVVPKWDHEGVSVQACFYNFFEKPFENKDRLPPGEYEALIKRRMEIWNRNGTIIPDSVWEEARRENEKLFPVR